MFKSHLPSLSSEPGTVTRTQSSEAQDLVLNRACAHFKLTISCIHSRSHLLQTHKLALTRAATWSPDHIVTQSRVYFKLRTSTLTHLKLRTSHSFSVTHTHTWRSGHPLMSARSHFKLRTSHAFTFTSSSVLQSLLTNDVWRWVSLRIHIRELEHLCTQVHNWKYWKPSYRYGSFHTKFSW